MRLMENYFFSNLLVQLASCLIEVPVGEVPSPWPFIVLPRVR